MKLDNVHIVILSSIKWDFLWQRHQIIAQYFSQFTEVTFIETTGLRNPNVSKAFERLNRGLTAEKELKNTSKIDNLTILPPIVAPPTYKLFRILNKKLFTPNLVKKIKKYSQKPIIFITYIPTSTSLFLMEQLEPIKTIYDCVLNFENFPGIPKDIVKTEDQLIQKSDVLIVDSRHLHKKHQSKKNPIIQIPAAVNFEHFHEIYVAEIESTVVKEATYFGGIDHYRFDWEIIEGLLDSGLTVKLIGPAPEGIPLKHSRLIHHDTIPHHELPAALSSSDVLILPYKVTEFTKGTFPAKLFECFATGKPIVATALPDLVHFSDVIEIGEDTESFTSKVLSAIRNDSGEKRNKRIELAKENSWEVRCKSYKEKLEAVLKI
ncbi:glycosyltransferase [Ureibacillus chungkukjangi]|uniref:glycosyltransferase n=1 Tax=Ureibacillus chungkukjangi TaxID=1202712 RepID=UPI00384FE0AB